MNGDDTLEGSTTAGWRQFRARLADHVAAMDDDDLLLIEVEWQDDQEDGAAPYVQLCGWGDDQVRLEAVSNHYLAPAVRLDDEGEATLLALGYEAPSHGPEDGPDGGSANFYVDLDRGCADRAAEMAVRALRDVYGVVHPAFLDVGALTLPEPEVTEPGEEGEGPEVAYPGGRDHLQSLVDAALVPFLGHSPEHDEDGDIPVVLDSTVVFVRVLDEVPVVRMFALVVRDVEHPERAAFEVGVLNRDTRLVKFVWTGQSVMASVELPAWPFVGDQLRSALAMTIGVLDQVAPDLAVRLGGRTVIEASPEVGAAPAEDPEPERSSPYVAVLRVLHELDTESPGEVDPVLAAGLCEDDRDLILEVLSRATDREASWRVGLENALDEGDDDEAELCAEELERAVRLIALLRAALRRTVERQVEATRAAQHERSRRRGRRRRVPDPTLDEVDPGMWG
ncbi:T3SS (YopN, CesT) and YbjN peptide-binding chaperone 1 [Nocardioides caldifontis]|uniref:T3SS (YopN, CesT) and YbjN peptide-binding chaperone 1 n=1 Tax=Nocardioides caldifontis TaxID=2588938 RepID=UPI0011DFBB80|nr:hypothetical protein [Nocardioides caldifontis]